MTRNEHVTDECLGMTLITVDACSMLIYLSKYLDQETAKEPFSATIQAATCNYRPV